MPSFWNGTGGAQLRNVVNRLKPQTGAPNTGTPNTNPQVDTQPLGGPQTGAPNTGNPSQQPMPGAPLGGPITYPSGMQGQASRGGIPGMPWQTGAPNTGTPGAGPMAGFPHQWGQPSTQSFSATNNLVGTQFNPTPSTQTQGAARATQGALSQYMQQPTQQQYAGVTPGRSSDTQALQGYAMGAAGTYAGAGGPPNLTNPAFQGIGANTYAQSQGVLSSLAGGGMGQAQGGSFGYNGDTQQARGLTMQQLQQTLNTTPDRASLASSSLQRMIEDSNPQFQQDLRAVGQKAAALGRVGSGMTTSDLGDVAQRRNEQIVRRAADLADNAAGLSLSDQQAKLAAAQGTTSALGGLDTSGGSLNLKYLNASNSALGQNQDARYRGAMGLADLQGQSRNEAVGERNAAYSAGQDANNLALNLDNTRFSRLRGQATDLAGLQDSSLQNDRALQGDQRTERNFFADQNQQGFNNARSRFNDLAGYQQGRESQDMNNLNWMRGERSYQQGLDQQAIDNNVRERLMQEDLLNGRFRRGMDLSQFGYGGDPTGTMLSAANMYGSQGNTYGNQASDAWGGAADAVSNWAYNRMRNRGTTQAPQSTNVTMDQWRNYGF